MFVAALFLLLPVYVMAEQGQVEEEQRTDQVGHQEQQASLASIAGTIWVGTDSDEDYYEYHFKEDGSFHYNSPTGFWKNGTWRQEGDTIYMETNNNYSEYEGKITGNRIEGNAWNIEERKWVWGADKKVDEEDTPEQQESPEN
jgi:hypothetical protein